jgi:hypothetical protein
MPLPPTAHTTTLPYGWVLGIPSLFIFTLLRCPVSNAHFHLRPGWILIYLSLHIHFMYMIFLHLSLLMNILLFDIFFYIDDAFTPFLVPYTLQHYLSFPPYLCFLFLPLLHLFLPTFKIPFFLLY